MKKRALVTLLFLSTTVLACQNDTKAPARGARNGALAPTGGTATTPVGSGSSTPAPSSLNWDGLSDRADAVWGF